MSKKIARCDTCDSTDLTWMSPERWDADTQAFVKVNSLSGQLPYCEECGTNVGVVWEEELHKPLLLAPVDWEDIKVGEQYLYHDGFHYYLTIKGHNAVASQDLVRRWKMPYND